MNREILFKAKRTDTKKWIEGNYITDEQNPSKAYMGYLFGVDDDGAVHDTDIDEVDPETVCQYTGLTDKNGRKIFEGDIVSYENKNFIMKYIDGFAAFDLRSSDNMNRAPCITTNTTPRMEVIGNIFDNPELLNQ